MFFAYVLRGSDNNSIMLFLWIIFVCFFSDVGGYFFGKVIGGKKITKFSPNKTFAGMYGSFIFSTFPIIFFYFIDIMFLKFNIIFLSTKTIILSLILSLICQMGDIAISYSKHLGKNIDEIIYIMSQQNALTYTRSQYPVLMSRWDYNYLSWKNFDVPKLIIKYEN